MTIIMMFNYIYMYLDLQLLHYIVLAPFEICLFPKFAQRLEVDVLDVLNSCSLNSIGRTSFLKLRPIALICARLRLFAPEIAAMFFAPNGSRLLILITILDICSNAQKVQGGKK